MTSNEYTLRKHVLVFDRLRGRNNSSSTLSTGRSQITRTSHPFPVYPIDRGNRFFDEVVTSDSTAPLEGQPQDPTRLATPTMSEPSLLTSDNGVVVKDCGPDYTSANSYDPSGRPFLAGVPYLRLQLGLHLASGTPSFTNFTPEFTDTLDYVFIEGGSGSGTCRGQAVGQETPVVMVEKGAIAPMPEEGTLRAITPGLPSETFPSDHVSLVVDLSIMS